MESKTFGQWLSKYKPIDERQESVFKELECMRLVRDEFRSQVYLLKKYMSLIRENYDQLSIIEPLRTGGVAEKTNLSIHKILFHAPDKAKCWDEIDKILDEKTHLIIDKL